MAVYTSLTVKELAPLLAKYDIGKPLELTPLEGGTTNSNFRLKTTKGNYVFTVLEPAEEAAQMVWLPNYLTCLSENNIPVPRVINCRGGQAVVKVKEKSAIITPFLEGKEVAPSKASAFKAGRMLAEMNNLSDHYPHKTPSPPWRVQALNEKRKLVREKHLSKNDARALEAFDAALPNWESVASGLPSGVAHTDLFPDNVLFSGGAVSGVIDFYKAGEDILVFDLAMGLTAWGFDEDGKFNKPSFKGFYDGYTKTREITSAELEALPALLSRACGTIILMRILRRQILDSQNSSNNDITPALTARSPEAYLKRLMFLKENNLQALIDA